MLGFFQFQQAPIRAPRVPSSVDELDRDLLAIALCGRSSFQSVRLALHFRRASSRLMNQWAFKHSAR